MSNQSFGGKWTEQKLLALEKYLRAYLQIFTKNSKAKMFTRHYVDAFAGSGWRSISKESTNVTQLSFPILEDIDEIKKYAEGSVRRVLSLDDALDFHRYWFVEKDNQHAESLRKMIATDFPDKNERFQIEKCDANQFIPKWINNLQWNDRAVVFLDPYGMDVKWTTIEIIAKSKKVDLWMLFPTSAVIRLMPKKYPPKEEWEHRLTEFFGDDSWKDEFYQESIQPDIFGETGTERTVTDESVANYLLRRLENIFAGVIDQPLVLKNSRNSTLFMLVFAAGNPNGAELAKRIANNIVETTSNDPRFYRGLPKPVTLGG